MHDLHHIYSFNDATTLDAIHELFGKKCNCTLDVAMISACGCSSCRLYLVYRVAICCLLANEHAWESQLLEA